MLEDRKLYTTLFYWGAATNAEGYDGYYGTCLDLDTGGVCTGWESSPYFISDPENTLVKAIGQGPLNCDAPAYIAPEPVKKPVPQQQVEVRSEVKAQVQSGAIVQSHGLVQSQVVQQGYVTVPRPPIVQQRYVLQGYVTPGQLQQGYATGQLRPGTGTETFVNREYVKGGVLTGSTVNSGYVNGGYVSGGYANGGMVPGTLNQTVTTPPRSW